MAGLDVDHRQRSHVLRAAQANLNGQIAAVRGRLPPPHDRRVAQFACPDDGAPLAVGPLADLYLPRLGTAGATHPEPARSGTLHRRGGRAGDDDPPQRLAQAVLAGEGTEIGVGHGLLFGQPAPARRIVQLFQPAVRVGHPMAVEDVDGVGRCRVGIPVRGHDRTPRPRRPAAPARADHVSSGGRRPPPERRPRPGRARRRPRCPPGYRSAHRRRPRAARRAGSPASHRW